MINKMGVKGLAKYLRTQLRHLYRTCGPGELRGKRVAIDVGGFLHQFTITMSYPHQFLHRFQMFARQLRTLGIPHVFVFDGPSCRAKGPTLTQRASRRDQYMRNLHRKIGDAETEEVRLARGALVTGDLASLDTLRFRKLLWHKKTARVNRSFLYQLQTFFVGTRIPFLIADQEAEKACAWLAQNNFVDYVASEDYDTLACGAPLMLCSWSGFLYEGKPLKLLSLSDVLANLRIGYPRFVDACVLAGSDFSRPPVHLGFARALALLQEYRSLEAVFQKFLQRYYISGEATAAGLRAFQTALPLFTAPHLPFVRSLVVALFLWLGATANIIFFTPPAT